LVCCSTFARENEHSTQDENAILADTFWSAAVRGRFVPGDDHVEGGARFRAAKSRNRATRDSCDAGSTCRGGLK
jgi:hypothetical protein